MIGSGDRIDSGSGPLAAVAVAVLAVSTSAILIRWSDAPASVAAFYRVTLTTLLLTPVAATRYRAAFGRIDRRDLLAAGAAGAALAVHFAAWFESLEWTSVAASVTLVQSQPVFVALGAAFLLDERVGRRTVLGVALALSGMAAMALGEAGSAVAGARPLYGNALAVLGAVTAAAYVLAGRDLRQRVPLVPYAVVVYSVCAVFLLFFVLVRRVPVVDYPPREWLLFFAMAVGPGVLGHTLVNWALKHVESTVVSVSLVGEPVGSTLLALFLLGEVPAPVTVVGGAVVVAGIAVTATGGAGDGFENA